MKRKNKALERFIVHMIMVLIYAFLVMWTMLSSLIAVAMLDFNGGFIVIAIISVIFMSYNYIEVCRYIDVYDNFLNHKRLTDEYLRYRDDYWKGIR